MALTNESYPLTTQDGQAIPLDVINPSGLIYQDASTSAWADITIPAGMTLATFKASEDTLVDLTGTMTVATAVATHYPSMLFVPKGFVVASVVAPGPIKVRALSAASRIYIQGIYRWASLALARQNTTVVSRN